MENRITHMGTKVREKRAYLIRRFIGDGRKEGS